MQKKTIVNGWWMLLSLGVAACGGKEEPPPETAQGQTSPYMQPQGQGQPPYGQPQGQQQGQPYGQQQGQPYGQGQPAPSGQAQQPTPGQVPALGAVMADPQALQNIIAGALSAGAATLSPMAGGELGPIEAGIKMRANQDAKGAKPEGQLMSAKLQAGGHAEGSFTMQAGACYSVLGFGGPGVFDYQINILTAPPMPPQVLAQSSAGGVAPTVGPNEQCLRNPYPLPMTVKVDMHVIRGQGLVGAQVYRK